MCSFRPQEGQQSIECMLKTTRTDCIVELLKKLKNTAVPKSIDSGEAITYLAVKDTILNNVISFFDTSKSLDAAKPVSELCVDHQKLANAVLERTFDSHMQLLRHRLKEAESEAEMWRKVALLGQRTLMQNSSSDVTALLFATREQHRCHGTQTSLEDVPPNTNPTTTRLPSSNSLSAVEQLLAAHAENLVALLNQKVDLLCNANFSQLTENRSPLGDTKPKTAIYTGSDSDRCDRSLPGTTFEATCAPLKRRNFKVASNPIAPTKNCATKSPTDRQKVAIPSSQKHADGAAFARQDVISPNVCARYVETHDITQPLYVLHALQLNPRNGGSSDNVTRFPRNEERRLSSRLPPL
ncbi:hypothetical protein ABB37_08433 [Leptomonas pyrrhocoris]|uniref:Uncharacterized protein n=1 Tax=Leptomonas pyrrhocoris TaxID=157538 RepID=A0A0M9FT79_LEPPY|nr:hypothetical protein ABB37_08433 [Leptomonas pyrrhocoris]KPA75543.1 hypothetical protein ABB37_08433 [Leptomonas pyrrhocoris]|eukprot:XP_015653982.1 hypothetical protein ABB37_08433 [Leptomonas pyrrhocoris]